MCVCVFVGVYLRFLPARWGCLGINSKCKKIWQLMGFCLRFFQRNYLRMTNDIGTFRNYGEVSIWMSGFLPHQPAGCPLANQSKYRRCVCKLPYPKNQPNSTNLAFWKVERLKVLFAFCSKRARTLQDVRFRVRIASGKQIIYWEGMSYVISGAGGATVRARSNQFPEGVREDVDYVHDFAQGKCWMNKKRLTKGLLGIILLLVSSFWSKTKCAKG